MVTSHAQVANLADAVRILEEDIRAFGSERDKNYAGHIPRYVRNVRRIQELAAPGATIFDIGSHYLHQAVLLKLVGYDVTGLDVGVFAQSELVIERAKRFGIENHACDRFEDGRFLEGEADRFDLIVFCEILEHITFNPVAFWKRVYELMQIGGKVYLTTPSSMTPYKIAHYMKRQLLLRGNGIDIPSIFGTITYGHHWKEYSPYEVRKYFESLTPDFGVRVQTFNFRGYDWRWLAGPKTYVRNIVRGASSVFSCFGEEIEAVITLRGRSRWLINPPTNV